MPAGIDGEHFDALMADLDRAAGEMIAWLEAEPDRWTRGRPGKWSAGQHVEHIVISLAVPADAFERRVPSVLDGTIAPRPRRGPLQWVWVTLVAGRGWMPRGIRTPRRFEAGTHPARTETLDRLRREVARFRAMGHKLSAAQRDRLWIRNPFMERWHYTLAEMVRVETVHVRHHLRQIEEMG